MAAKEIARGACVARTTWLLLRVLGVLCGYFLALIKRTAESAEDAEDCFAGK